MARARVAGGDPGYGETARMVSEAVLLILSGHAGPGGVLTPAVALGDTLVRRLRECGMVFEVLP